MLSLSFCIIRTRHECKYATIL